MSSYSSSVTLQKCSVGYGTSPDFPSVWLNLYFLGVNCSFKGHSVGNTWSVLWRNLRENIIKLKLILTF